MAEYSPKTKSVMARLSDWITIDPSPAMRRYLAQLVQLGVYGKTPTTAARRLIRKASSSP